jgi:phage tail tape-measure protein
MEEKELVTVYTVTSPAEAELIRGALESAGIACTIGGESQAGLAGVLSIDILTAAEDVERARAELKTLRKEKKERRHAQIEKRKEREAHNKSEATTDLNANPPASDIQKPAE